MDLEKVFAEYEKIIGLVEIEFDRNLRIYSNQMQCGKGCSSCCSQIFKITLIDAAKVSGAVKKLEPVVRVEMQKRAGLYLEGKERFVEGRARGLKSVDDDLETPNLGLRLPCPALENDTCQIYDSRPVVCHKYGMPLYNPKSPDQLQACELNFGGGEEFEGEELIRNQTQIHDKWMDLKTRVNTELDPDDIATTVAEAILFDYEAMLNDGIYSKDQIPRILK